MFCENCGAQVNGSQRFCPHCGSPIAKANGSFPTNSMGTPGYVSPVPASQRQRRSASFAIPALAVICTALVMVVIGFSLIASGSLNVGGSKPPQASSQTVATGTATKDDTDKAKKEEEEKAEEKKAEEESSKQEPAPVVNNNITINTEPAPTVSVRESTPAPAPAPEPTYSYSDYVLPDSASHYYSTSELSSLSNWDLYIARNEIYARHGRGFVRDDLREYFSHCSWYTERYDPDYFDDNIAPNMSDCEWHNIQTILDYEHYRGSPYP